MQEIRHGDCLAVMREMPDASVDAVVTDPPYGLAFMGKRWDYDVPSVEVWYECLRVLKPGGHLLAFAGTRTQHRMAVRIEDAGFEIRDMIAWVYGSGFPKSHDVSKSIDREAGAVQEVVSRELCSTRSSVNRIMNTVDVPRYNTITAPATPEAKQWAGWGTALKPALEPITVARKPLTGTVAENVLAHGTGALNVDGCRVGTDGGTAKGSKPMGEGNGIYGAGLHGACEITQLSAGRWPANLIHDGSEEVVGLFPANRPGAASNGSKSTGGLAGSSTFAIHPREQKPGRGDSGSAARFFYCAKASKRDRDEGCEGMEARARKAYSGPVTSDPRMTHEQQRLPSRNHHPTVKPTDLMRYLCRLVTPPGGIVLDPFMGSGSTGKAAALEGFRFIGIERESEYVEIARARIAAAVARAGLFERTAS
ncbi:MAG: DNA-methyltransferase [bacterium]